MFAVLDGSEGNVLGVEISGAYTKNDVGAFEKAFESCLKSGDKVNVLVKIDGLEIGSSEFGAFWEDSRYALKNLDKIGHIALVGHSRIEEILTKMDNMFFVDSKKGREEKYFDVSEIDKAWEFVRG